ncbi:MAG: class I adenylate-forming enzyme family protein [Vicinamibacterales bacterium]
MSKTSSIAGAFSQLVARRASEVMVASPSARATFGDIDALSRALGERLSASGLAPGSLVGLAAPNGPAFLAGFLALRRTQQTAVLLDPLAPPEDRRRVVAAIGVAAVLSCAKPWPSSAAEFQLTGLEPSAQSCSQGDVAAVKLTSGSTGAPRGVAMRDEHLLADEGALALTMGFRDTDRLLGAVPLSHSYGFTTLALSSIVRGLTLVLPSDQGPFAQLDAARELGATIFPTVPAYFQALLKMSEPPAWPGTVRLVISAGAVLPGATAAQFRETYAQPVHVFYGSSECGGICYDRDGGAAERGGVGTPVEGVRVSIMPIDQQDGSEGLVAVESAGVGLTYLPDPDARLAGGRFETCDVAAWQGGEVVLRRRIDQVINLRGRKVDPSEVERVLAALDGVDEAVVLGVSSAGGEEIVRAVVACAAGRLNYQSVAAWCRHKLADHKVPRSVIIVDAIPRTSRGKIDRAALLGMSSTRNDTGEARG